MLGRLLGGVATSLLFSVFEAWLIRSHSDANLGKNFLSQSFSAAAYGNSVIAILAGLIANKAASSTSMEPVSGKLIYVGGYLNPVSLIIFSNYDRKDLPFSDNILWIQFDIALCALVLCGIFCATLWEENYGEEHHANGREEEKNDDGRQSNWSDGLKNAFVVTVRSRDILLCGIISSLFEGSMYIFVFMWTPALTSLMEDKKADLPFGVIFSTFMISCMAGSSLFSILIAQFKGEAVAVGVFGVSAISMALVALGTTDTVKFIGMLVFEMCVGIYFPVMGTMKGSIVPEDKRAAIYNLFRIPLNFIVLFSLLTDLTPTMSFTLNAVMLAIATFLQTTLMMRRLNMSKIADLAEKSSQQSNVKASEDSVPLMEESADGV
jgi:MFS transporter, MFS domain-containing protein family, molybdate-anion transporter